jgi:carbon storage regulator
MLVLSRKTEESLMIGEDIVVTILAVVGERVKIGIQAPPNIRILRQELYDMVKQENIRAAKSSATSNAALPKLYELFQAAAVKENRSTTQD